MSGIGSMELLVIFLVALLVMGPEKTKEATALFGKCVRVIRQIFDEIKKSVQQSDDLEDVKSYLKDVQEDANIDDELEEVQKSINQVKKVAGGK